MEIIKADTIEQYNRFFGFQTRHPLVGIVHFDRSENQPTHKMTFGFYALFLKKTVGCTINYGKTKYDFDDETVVCFAPGQTVGIHRIEEGPVPEADALLFHPDFLFRTPLAQKMKRFYERQFVTREVLNNDVLIRFEQLLDEYWDSGTARLQGLPTVKYFAEKICLSPNYFGDLVKSETGKSPHELIQSKIAEIAKSALLDPKMNTKQVADMLGFQYPQHFLRFFKKKVGCTPKEYRTQNNLTVCS